MICLLLLAYASLVTDYDEPQNEPASNTQYVEVDEEYEWWGPGYYYGIWFGPDDEEDYWQWRNNHPEYPPARNYYSPNHPIPYEHAKEGNAEPSQERRDDYERAPNNARPVEAAPREERGGARPGR